MGRHKLGGGRPYVHRSKFPGTRPLTVGITRPYPKSFKGSRGQWPRRHPCADQCITRNTDRRILEKQVQTQATTDGLKDLGGVSGAPGGRDEIHTLSINRRWIPPSILHKKDAFMPSSRSRPTFEIKNDTIFRNVRSILNKLTPENFHKLSDDLLKLELNSSVILKGVILLIFEKALDEPKYSSMYARLCQRLSKAAPNFEQPSEPSTFRILLLSKCRDEFENRSKANDAFDLQDGPLGPEEEERRQNAKRKMLGNIQFIGELGKLEILGESILHKCIHQLLRGKNKQDKDGGRDGGDVTEDLELLCQIMRTSGRTLDIKGDKLMDQYFERMALHAEDLKLPIRIRFMLRNVIELRLCRWVPREATSVEGPKPMHQIQTNDSRGMGNQSHMGFMSKSDVSMGSYNRPTRDRGFDYNNVGNYKNNVHQGDFRNGEKFNYFSQRQSQEQSYYPGKQQNFQRNGGQQNHNNSNNSAGQQHDSNNTGYKNDLPPRFTEKIKSVQPSQINLKDLSLRPPPQSMFRHANTKPAPASSQNHLSNLHMNKPITTMTHQLLKDPPALVKQASFDNVKMVKKEKSVPVHKETTVETLMEEYNSQGKLQDVDQKIPEKLLRPLLLAVMVHSLDKTDVVREQAYSLITQALKKPTNSTHFFDSYSNLLSHIEGKSETPTDYCNVVGFAVHAIGEGILSLTKLVELTENGDHYPLIFLVLQEFGKIQGETKLTLLFNNSKINLLKQLPEIDRNKEHLLKILGDHNLVFLLPLLGIQSELWKQLQADPNPTVFYKWIKDNVDQAHHNNPQFVNALATVVWKYIVLEADQNTELDSVAAMEKERTLLGKFNVVLQAFINENLNLQVTALYALQTFCHSLDFPKGLLLRWFVNLYDLEVVDEDAFIKWKEDVTDEYPGKGKALFQVNSWLTWLEEAESEGEDDDEA